MSNRYVSTLHPLVCTLCLLSPSITQRHFSAIDNILVDDCLQQIFVFASSQWDSAASLAISQVSRHWRDVALSTPEMWTQVSIDEDSIDYSIPRPHVRRRCRTPSIYFPTVTIMLQNSSHYPLDIRINIPAFGTGRSWFRSFYVDLLASVLYPHRARIASFESTSVSWEHHNNLLDTFKGARLPLLRSFIVQCPYAKNQSSALEFPIVPPFKGDCPVPFVESAEFYPNLKEISFLGTVCDWTKFSGRNLTSITLAGIPCTARPTIQQLRSILSMSKDTLKELKIDGALPCEASNDDITVEMHQLESLSLSYALPSELSPFAKDIHFPALKNLEIRNLCPQVIMYAQTRTAFEDILHYFPLERIQEVKLSGMRFGSEKVHYGMFTEPEPLELLRRLGTKEPAWKLTFYIPHLGLQWVVGGDGHGRTTVTTSCPSNFV